MKERDRPSPRWLWAMIFGLIHAGFACYCVLSKAEFPTIMLELLDIPFLLLELWSGVNFIDPAWLPILGTLQWLGIGFVLQSIWRFSTRGDALKVK